MALQDVIQINYRLKINFWNLIQIDSGFKKLAEFWFKSAHDSRNFSKSWFESTHDSMMLFIPSFVWPFLGVQLYRWLGMTFLGFSTQKSSLRMNFFGGLSTQVPYRQTDMNRLMTQAVSRRPEAIQLMTQRRSRNWLRINSRLKWIRRYWFRWTHDSKRFPTFLFKSTHASSEKHLILSRIMIRLLSRIHVWMEVCHGWIQLWVISGWRKNNWYLYVPLNLCLHTSPSAKRSIQTDSDSGFWLPFPLTPTLQPCTPQDYYMQSHEV